jgi:hypothetical protein
MNNGYNPQSAGQDSLFLFYFLLQTQQGGAAVHHGITKAKSNLHAQTCIISKMMWNMCLRNNGKFWA